MAAKKKTRKRTNGRRSPKTARLDLLIDPRLKLWVKKYAADKHTSITEIVTRHFVSLRDAERGADVEQI